MDILVDDLLINDDDPENKRLYVDSYGDPSHGHLHLTTTGSSGDYFVYRPKHNLEDTIEKGPISAGRWVARCLFRKSSDPTRPSIEKAWKRFEKTVLPRHFTLEKNDHSLVRATLGTSGQSTQLYSVLGTNDTVLGAHFGVGVGMYFWTLKCLTLILLTGGLMNLPYMLHLSSEQYDPDVVEQNFFIRASPICTNTKWVACPSCSPDKWTQWPDAKDRFAVAVDDSTQQFILINQCDVDGYHFIFAYAGMIFVILAIFIMMRLALQKEVVFDEAAQTTSDYSIQVLDPPSGDYDPDEWASFFSQFGRVAAVTVAVDNEALTDVLIARRALLKRLTGRLPLDFAFDKYDLAAAVRAAAPLVWYEKLTATTAPAQLYSKIMEYDEQVKELMNTHYDVASVFVTFDKEHYQRKALSRISSRSTDDKLLFKGLHKLRIVEPKEPNSIRWEDLEESFVERVGKRSFSEILNIIFIIFDFFLLSYIFREYGAGMFGFAVTGMSYVSFYFIMYIVDFEPHMSEGSRDSSLYVKLNLFRWINSSIMTSYITAFANILSNDDDSMIKALYAIFFYEILKGPLMELCDPKGTVFKFMLAPWSKSQKAMNSFFRGKYWDLSERYTDMTSIVFLVMYNSILFPAGFFLGAIALGVHYFSDKYCLLRVWSSKPSLGNATAVNSRTFIMIAIIFYTFFASYDVASFPYDNGCSTDKLVPSSYVGTFYAKDLLNTSVTLTISSSDNSYKFCEQSMMEFFFSSFPPTPDKQPPGEEWMTEDQEQYAQLYGMTSLVILALVVLYLVGRIFSSCFCSICEVRSEVQEEKFSDLKVKTLYVPQRRVYGTPLPLLLIDSSDFSKEFIGWSDPTDPSYEEQNVLYDVKACADKVKAEHLSESQMFGAVKYYLHKKDL